MNFRSSIHTIRQTPLAQGKIAVQAGQPLRPNLPAKSPRQPKGRFRSPQSPPLLHSFLYTDRRWFRWLAVVLAVLSLAGQIEVAWVLRTGWSAEPLSPIETRVLADWIRSGIVQVHLVRGRVEWTGRTLPGGRGMGKTSSTISSGGVRRLEKISLSGGENFSLTYKQESKKQMYSLSVAPDRTFRVQWQSMEPELPETIELEQTPRQPVVVKRTAGPTQQVWKATTLWHLAMEEPEVVRKYIVPLFISFLPSVSLLSQTKQVERQMLELARTSRTPDRGRWEALVAQLADDSYSRREAADRALRQQGPAVVPFLRSLDWQPLDAEQRFRLRRILQELEPPGDEDSLTKTAHWLLQDPEVWWILLDRPDVEKRRIAAQRLAVLLGTPIEFDPEASPEIRQAQRSRLEPKVRPNQPAAAGKS